MIKLAMRLCLFGAAVALSAAGDPRSKAFPPGWNGLARTPPLGWRSWNAYGNRITQDMLLENAKALSTRNRTWKGQSEPVSLCELGYCSVGVDEGWEGCGEGVNGTQHDAAGRPTIDTGSFPSIPKMVAAIHALNLSAGWYLNGCKCGEHTEEKKNYEGDITSLHDFGFDGVKIDGCGAQRNQTFYAELMRKSGKAYTIENCHWGQCSDGDDSSCPTHEWCPFNWYRSSGDINSGASSWLANLQTTIRFQDNAAPLSVPGCWAYPDMLEVGMVQAPSQAASSFYTWNRAHFGAWCVTSSPLILGLQLSDDKLDPILDIIGNREALGVNQAWAGHPGTLVENLVAPPTPYSPSGATVPSSSEADYDLDAPASLTGGPSDARTSGHASIRSGNPGQVATFTVGSGLAGAGHRISSVKMSFRYLAGYTPAPGETKKAPTVRVLLLDLESRKEVACLFTSQPLGNYSFDHFSSFSPPVTVAATSLAVPNDSPLIIALEVSNHDRNLQIPVDDLADGMGIKVEWAAAAPSLSAPSLATPLAAPLGAALGLFGSGQLWAKRLPGGGSAILLINHSPTPLRYTLKLAKLNLTASSYEARDLWALRSLGEVGASGLPLKVPAYDSAFVELRPK